ncbi:PEP-utilizing enzyme [Novosphingobium resinovorum]|uniref:PEP-utilizing enzyme, mobile domain n=1 Tax=Novosphingobium resinovorum TaxID=158500 RepID=A0A031JDI3_9SPHN|nr:PEP-utilizing enzyme [Novosphingobium resinovorum]EZP71236.1 PEP-utilizing enzyme, mobile domain [Novosphingobium resinovorum]
MGSVKLPIDDVLHAGPPATPLVEAVLDLVRERIRARFGESGLDWDAFALTAADDLVTREDIESVEARILASGHRFDWSARVSVTERPEAHKPDGTASEASTGFTHPEAPSGDADGDGKALRGLGDNVVRYPTDIVGQALYVRSNERVMELLSSGVPTGAIAIIDDSGGTLTAPIIDQFAGVVCAGGSVRSHLGILTREYNIPCLMNAKVAGIREGDRISVEVSAPAKTTEDYQKGVERVARVWVIGEAA